MALSPKPTPDQIESTRQVARLNSYINTAYLINKLTNASWHAALEILTLWPDARFDDVKIGGRVQIDPAVTRDLLTREMRLLLGLSADPSADLQSGQRSSSSPTEVIW